MVDQGLGSRIAGPVVRTSVGGFEFTWDNEAYRTVAGVKLSVTSDNLAGLVEKRLGVKARVFLDNASDDFLLWS